MLQEERSRGPWELGRKEGFLTLCGGVKEGFLEEESSRPRWEARQAEDRGVFQSRLFAIPWTVSPPGSSVCGILQARILEGVAIPFSKSLQNL